MVNQSSDSGEKRSPASAGRQLIEFISAIVMLCLYLVYLILLFVKLCFWVSLLILLGWLLWEVFKFSVHELLAPAGG